MNQQIKYDIDPASVARMPSQERARKRFETVLVDAEQLLIESGLDNFSIPILAQRLGYTRGSIYAWFPSTTAIFNELVSRHVDAIEADFYQHRDELLAMSWEQAVERVVSIAVNYHENNHGARLLMLGGSASNESYSAQEQLMLRLGALSRAVLELSGQPVVPTEPDVTTLTADIGVACLRRSFFLYGRITAEYQAAAISAMRGFLRPYLSPTG